jgi:hypothetical protein
LHEQLAINTFSVLFNSGVFVGQIRTRLGIPGYEAKGPEDAAKALLTLISKKDKDEEFLIKTGKKNQTPKQK